ncbi:MAG: endonuclease/exonuclease/phosphatase family protein [Mycobacterium sp.]
MPRTAVYLLAWFAFLVAAVAFAARFAPVVNHAVLLVSALSPYLMIGAVVSAGLLLFTGPWWAAAPAIVLTAAAFFVQLPLFTSSGNPTGPALRVLTANLHEGAADPGELAAIARDTTDVLVVQELTGECAEQLTKTGLESDFPYRAIAPASGADGIGVWSRHPIVDSARIPGYELGMLNVRIRVPDVPSDTTVLAVHLVGPWPWPIDQWRQEIAKLSETLREAGHEAGASALIVAGDFNATVDMAPFRRLLRDGLDDAREHSGAGLAATYPADGTLPPLVGIDHILVRNGLAADTHPVRIPGSDHLGLRSTIHITELTR